MIYIDNKREKQEVYIPVVNDISLEMRMKLVNNLTKKEVIIHVSDKNTSKMYFLFEIELPVLDDGEYTYELLDENDEKIASGLVQIGDYKPEKTVYNNAKNEYITYGE